MTIGYIEDRIAKLEMEIQNLQDEHEALVEDVRYLRNEIAKNQTIEAEPIRLLDKICEIFAECDPEWICDYFHDDDEQFEVCENCCKWNRVQPECIKRYAKWKMDEENGNVRQTGINGMA